MSVLDDLVSDKVRMTAEQAIDMDKCHMCGSFVEVVSMDKGQVMNVEGVWICQACQGMYLRQQRGVDR